MGNHNYDCSYCGVDFNDLTDVTRRPCKNVAEARRCYMYDCRMPMLSPETDSKLKWVDMILRLKAVQEGTRELDAEIAELLGHKITWIPSGTIQNANGGPVIHWRAPHPYAGRREPCPNWTTSVDAALTLVHLHGAPGLTWCIYLERKPTNGGELWFAALREHGKEGVEGCGQSAALALCGACFELRAAKLVRYET